MKRKWVKSCQIFIILVLGLTFFSSGLSGCRPFHTGNVSDFKKGVVCIFSTDDLDDMNYLVTGSGFGVGTVGEETDIFITNRHVVFNEDEGDLFDDVYILLEDNAVSISYDVSHAVYDDEGYAYDDTVEMKCKVNKSDMVRCKVLYPKRNDPEFPDIAILKAEKKVPGREALSLKKTGSESDLDGKTVYAIGYPGAADRLQRNSKGNFINEHLSADVSSSTLTSGTISRTFEFPSANYTKVIQHTAAINHGNSGGPLITEYGDVLGINTYSYLEASDEIAEYNMSVFTDYAIEKLDKLGIKYSQRSENMYPLLIACIAAAAVLLAVLGVISRKKKAAAGGKAAEAPEKDNKAGSGSVTPPKPPVSGPVPYRLQGISGCFANKRYPIKNNTLIGRSGDSTLVFPENTSGVSRHHCQLNIMDGELYLTDLGSTYGTFCNGVKQPANVPRKLKIGDVIGLGGNAECFRIEVSKSAGMQAGIS